MSVRRISFVAVMLFLTFMSFHVVNGQMNALHGVDRTEPLVKLGLERNSKLAALRAEVLSAEARLRQTRAFPNPTISYQQDQRRFGMERENMLSVEMPLEIFGTRSSRRSIARAESEIKRAELANAERVLAEDIRVGVARLHAARRIAGIIDELLISAERSLSISVEAVERGSKAPLEYNRELVEINRLRARSLSAKAAVIRRERELAESLGIETLLGTELPQSFGEPHTAPLDGARILAHAMVKRPDVTVARQRIALASGSLDAVRAAARPEVDLMLGVRDMKLGFPQRAFDSDGMLTQIEDRMRFNSYGVKIKIPLFDFKRGAIASERAMVKSAEQLLDSEILAVRRDVQNALTRYEFSSKTYLVIRDGAIAQARDNYRVLELAFNEGAIPLEFLLRERRNLLEFEIELIEAALEMNEAEAGLASAMGSTSLDVIRYMP